MSSCVSIRASGQTKGHGGARARRQVHGGALMPAKRDRMRNHAVSAKRWVIDRPDQANTSAKKLRIACHERVSDCALYLIPGMIVPSA